MTGTECEQNGQDTCHLGAYTLEVSELAGLIQLDLLHFKESHFMFRA